MARMPCPRDLRRDHRVERLEHGAEPQRVAFEDAERMGERLDGGDAPLAGLFAALTGTAIGFINVFVGLGRRGFTTEMYTISAIGTAESLVPLFVGFACLTVAWLLVAAGMGRQTD